MAGIYLHIPFCRQACTYCNFHFSTSLSQKKRLLQAIEKEMILRKDFLSGKQINTIYFGGGTPSILEPSEIKSILENIKRNFSVNYDAEISIEANPEDVSEQSLEMWRQMGVNRLSIGIQSFDQNQLTWMNRSHNVEQATNAISLANNLGIQNISVDFIFNLPQQKFSVMESEIRNAMLLGAKHISIYGLTVEEKTMLAKYQKNGTFVHDEDKGSELFENLMTFMTNQNWIHYEISNYAMNEDFISKHNSSYWKGLPYLGLGPSAHSYNGEFRWFNVANNSNYCLQIEQGNHPGEWESLEEYQRFNEKVLIGLRTHWGVSFDEIKNQFSKKYANHFQQVYNSLQHKDWLEEKSNTIFLTPKGKLLADYITTLFFFPS